MHGRPQRAFFCDKHAFLSEVISSPDGFSSAFKGMVLLFALDLRYAEAMNAACDWHPCDCGASSPRLQGRAVLAELAPGDCTTLYNSRACAGWASGTGQEGSGLYRHRPLGARPWPPDTERQAQGSAPGQLASRTCQVSLETNGSKVTGHTYHQKANMSL